MDIKANIMPPAFMPQPIRGQQPILGLSCRKCGCRDLPVYYTRPRVGGMIIRSRTCRNCGTHTITRERAG